MQDKTFIERNYKTVGYAFGSCVAEIITNPLFSIKTGYQTSNYTTRQVISNIYYQYGLLGFFNSVYSAVFARVISAFIKFAIYNEIKNYRSISNDDIFNNMINGCIAGILCSFFVHPIDVISNSLQRFENFTVLNLTRKILYSGFSQTIIRNLILYSILFPVFDYSKSITNNNIPLSCLITTTISTITLQPVEFIRTKWMARQNLGVYKSFLQSFKTCWRGYHLNYMANTLHFMISMSISHYLTQKN
jgi:hypothetical protein